MKIIKVVFALASFLCLLASCCSQKSDNMTNDNSSLNLSVINDIINKHKQVDSNFSESELIISYRVFYKTNNCINDRKYLIGNENEYVDLNISISDLNKLITPYNSSMTDEFNTYNWSETYEMEPIY